MKFSELTKPELDEILENANFTEEEENIFTMLAREKTLTEVAQRNMICERTVQRKVDKIKVKIEKLEVLK